jgi:hypothetical protein
MVSTAGHARGNTSRRWRTTKSASHSSTLKLKPGYHVFDAAAFRKSMILTGAPTLRHYRLVEDNDHRIMNSETQKPFTYDDTCVEKGATIAYNEAASITLTCLCVDF